MSIRPHKKIQRSDEVCDGIDRAASAKSKGGDLAIVCSDFGANGTDSHVFFRVEIGVSRVCGDHGTTFVTTSLGANQTQSFFVKICSTFLVFYCNIPEAKKMIL